MNFEQSILELSDGDDILAELSPIIERIVGATGVDPGQILLVGAYCRDLLHSRFGHTTILRTTSDLDLGIGLGDWSAWERLRHTFNSTGGNGIRFIVEGFPVDILPFGQVENPSGLSHPVPRQEDLVVFGFQAAHRDARRIQLPGGIAISLPTATGYAALKIRAWIDRSKWHELKDARDLAQVLSWFAESSEAFNSLYETAEGNSILERADFDPQIAAAMMLAHDLRELLDDTSYADLVMRWNASDLALLANQLTTSEHDRTPLQARKRMVAELLPTARTSTELAT